MIEVSINNLTRGKIDGRFVEETARRVIRDETGAFSAGRDMEVSIVFVGPARIRQLNATYRKKDYVTDVLSFTEDQLGTVPVSEPRPLGELAICLDQVKKDARASKVSVKRELAWVVIHGILHLLGYDHEKDVKEAGVMRSKEEGYLSKINLENIKKA